MLMTSGVKYGLGPTLPHMAGVILGFGLMIAVVGLGLDILFQRFPQILPVMRVAGSIYMIWLALKIALAKPIGEVEAGGRPIGFLAAAGFQWVNPKAWVMALSALAAYAGVVDGYTSRHIHFPTMLPLEGLHIEPLASLAQSALDAQDRLDMSDRVMKSRGMGGG
jgi:threonine/homoserine/homoserine lactone efflux protein